MEGLLSMGPTPSRFKIWGFVLSSSHIALCSFNLCINPETFTCAAAHRVCKEHVGFINIIHKKNHSIWHGGDVKGES